MLVLYDTLVLLMPDLSPRGLFWYSNPVPVHIWTHFYPDNILWRSICHPTCWAKFAFCCVLPVPMRMASWRIWTRHGFGIRSATPGATPPLPLPLRTWQVGDRPRDWCPRCLSQVSLWWKWSSKRKREVNPVAEATGSFHAYRCLYKFDTCAL